MDTKRSHQLLLLLILRSMLFSHTEAQLLWEPLLLWGVMPGKTRDAVFTDILSYIRKQVAAKTFLTSLTGDANNQVVEESQS